jgi:uncharacterized membrane protein
MNWLFFALSAQFTWAIVNHFDKHLVNKYFNGGVGAMMIFTAFVNSIFLPFILFFNQQILDTPLIQILLASSVGACYVIGSIFYLYALRKEETTNISILWQFSVPVTYLLGYIFLRETLSTQQIIGALIVLTGGLVTMVKIDNKRFSIKSDILLLMILAVLIHSLSSSIFKAFALNFDFWSAIFFEIFGALITGVLLVIVVKSYRVEFKSAISKNRKKVFTLNFINEFMQISANTLFRFSTMLAPLALVQVTNSLNSPFVFVIAVILSIFLPNISNEKFSKFTVAQKILGIVVVSFGIIYLQ